MHNDLEKLTKLIRYFILLSTTAAGSGHPTSSFSAVELMTVLFFKYFHSDLTLPDLANNDRLIFSKGHASPLFYALYAAAGKVTEEDLKKLRTFDSILEGHPTMRFPYTEAPTGSLGQGLSIGLGEALAIRKKTLDAHTSRATDLPKVFVLLGDGEMAEGSVWEAIQLASYHKVGNLVGILDVNRLGQSQETMWGHSIETYAQRISSFGWRVITLDDGHDLGAVDGAFNQIESGSPDLPTMIIAKTIKGNGVSFLENKDGWHGKALSKEEFEKALIELGTIEKEYRGNVLAPQISVEPEINEHATIEYTTYAASESVATRKAYGNALVHLGVAHPEVVVLDAEVKNSTYALDFAKAYPDRYFEMFIAEQNMVGVGVGLSRLGYKPFLSSFACFLSRAADQIRMAAMTQTPLVFCGSHAGVSIGEDGPSQMGLEDLSLFKSLWGSIVLYPSDAIATEKLVSVAYHHTGVSYIRTTRPNTPLLYEPDSIFTLGGSHIFESSIDTESPHDRITLVAAGITVHEALAVQKELAQKQIAIDVVDCYSIKPIDHKTLKQRVNSKCIIVVEDHYLYGGLGDSVLDALADGSHCPVYKRGVSDMPRSGKSQELLEYEGIGRVSLARFIEQLQ